MHPDIFLTIDKNSSSITILFQQNSVFHFSQQQKILLRYMIVWNMVYDERTSSLWHKFKLFSNPYSFAAWSCKPLIFRIYIISSQRNHSLKYIRSTTLGYKNIGKYKIRVRGKTLICNIIQFSTLRKPIHFSTLRIPIQFSTLRIPIANNSQSNIMLIAHVWYSFKYFNLLKGTVIVFSKDLPIKEGHTHFKPLSDQQCGRYRIVVFLAWNF